MQQTKLGLRKLKESKESRQERYKCYKALKQNPLIRLDVRNKSLALLAREWGQNDMLIFLSARGILLGMIYSMTNSNLLTL
ncbi:hypothetical protein [Parabacteroides provencensis]|uniref:hypothetical protein n=1 Tax=Parabacteroides provencensis TaxID=1944636 RepID=UPI000C147EF7|nr:hypothetical protein [Parabacteroides provencensis]